MLWDSQRCFRILEDVLRFLGMFLGFLRMFQDSQGCYGIPREVSGFSEMLWDSWGRSRILDDFQGFFEIPTDVDVKDSPRCSKQKNLKHQNAPTTSPPPPSTSLNHSAPDNSINLKMTLT